MQKSIRANEQQLLYLASKAREGCLSTMAGNLWKRSIDTGKWQLRYFVLYQNLLFYYDCERSDRPSGIAFLESSYCEPIVNLKTGRDDKTGVHHGYCFAIYYKKEGVRQYDLRADTEEDCRAWIDAINGASFGKLLEQKQQAEQKQLHLLQILDTEHRAKWHYVQQIEELTAEVKRLKTEFNGYRIDRRISPELVEESDELKKIKKVQSFFRGWMCRRRWKQIVEEYIRSEHAESMRKRNNIVFGLVECEDEYVQQLSILVTCYLRPFRMAASSKKPIVSHEDVNSIFLNAETVLFLHQFFVQGLRNKMENWPTLQLGDLFDLLLPMLGIYQEYVRNHHYSLQVLAEYKQRPEFNQMLKRLEEKPLCEGRSIESFLTYPMHQIPRYIITLHELLAHTPHDHVDRKKLEYAKSKLEQISHIMHDEVSETENIRKNLAIERMIVDGCDLLLDVNQVFVRQGTLIQVICDKLRSSRSRLGTFGGSSRERKEAVRQVFLFTNHLLITARTNNGKLRLVKNYGKVSLVECTLVEDTTAELFSMEDDGPAQNESTNNHSDQRTIENGQPLMTRSSCLFPLSTSASSSVSTSTTTTATMASMVAPMSPMPLSSGTSGSSILTTTHGSNSFQNTENQSQKLGGSNLGPDLIQSGRNSVPIDPSTRLLGRRPQTADLARKTTTAFPIPLTTSTNQTSLFGSGPNTTSVVQHRHSTSLCMADSSDIPDHSRGSSSYLQSGPQSNVGTGRSSLNTSHLTCLNQNDTTVQGFTFGTALNSTSTLLHRLSGNMGLTGSMTNNTNCTDKADYGNLDFRLIWEPKNGPPTSIWLVASTLQEKAAWCSDISQCIEQLHYGDILNSAQSDVSSVAMPQSIRSDPRLFKDDVDIKFSHTLNSCKVPQIRYASVSRLLDRLTDARFLSIDFLNTFLLTYRVFTTGLTVIWALGQVLANPEIEGAASSVLQTNTNVNFVDGGDHPAGSSSNPSRPSDTHLSSRLPALEETLHSTAEETSSTTNSHHEVVEVEQSPQITTPEIFNQNPNNVMDGSSVSAEVVPITSTASTASSAAITSPSINPQMHLNVINKRQYKLHPRPLSTSEATSSSLLAQLSNLNLNRMFRSEISENARASPNLDQDKSNSGTIVPPPPAATTSTTMSTGLVDHKPVRTVRITNSPPPLIPRSPVFSGLSNVRDDPPLELPILPISKGPDKKSPTAKKLTSHSLDYCDSTQKQQHQQRPSAPASLISTVSAAITIPPKGHARLAPLASCEVIPDETDQYVRTEQQELGTQLTEPTHVGTSTSKSSDSNAAESVLEPGPIQQTQVETSRTQKLLCPMIQRSNSSQPLKEKESNNLLKSDPNRHGSVSDLPLTYKQDSQSDNLGKALTGPDQSEHPQQRDLAQNHRHHHHHHHRHHLTVSEFPGLDKSLTALDQPTSSLTVPLDAQNLNGTMNTKLNANISLTNLDENKRLLESYLNQTIGPSLLGSDSQTETGTQSDQLTRPGSAETETTTTTTKKKKKLASESMDHPKSTVDCNQHVNFSAITESLDLATKVTALTRKPKIPQSACQSLAKHTMIAALNCSAALPGIRSGSNRFDLEHHPVFSPLSNLKKCSNPDTIDVVHSSPSSPRKLHEHTTKIKITKPSVKWRHRSRDTESPLKSQCKSTEIGGSHVSSNSPEKHSDSSLLNICSHDADPNRLDKRNRMVSESQVGRRDNTDPEKPHSSSFDSPLDSGQLYERNSLTRTMNTSIGDYEHTDSLSPGNIYESVQIGGGGGGVVSGVGADTARGSVISWSGVPNLTKPKRPSVFSCPETEVSSPRPSVNFPSLNDPTSFLRTRAGAVVTSSRRSKRRSSNTAAAQAFAVATAGSASPLAATGIMGFGPHYGRLPGARLSTVSQTSVPRTSCSTGSGHQASGTTSSSSNSITSSAGNVATAAISNSASMNAGSLNANNTSSSGRTSLSSNSTSALGSIQPSQSVFRFSLRNGTNVQTTGPSFHSSGLSSPTWIGSTQNIQSSLNQQARRTTIMATASCLRVLNVVRHWITKFPDDFESDPELKKEMQILLETLVTCPHLMPNDQKAAGQLLHQMICDQLVQDHIDLEDILTPTQVPSEKNFDQLSALDISEQLTFLDFQIFRSIRSEELLNQSWMKLDKEEKAKHVLLVCKRFNEVSRLVVSEIISRTDLNDRVMCIDKWVAIADICRCMQNYNGVLQICAALVNSSIYRLRRTWERVSKQTKQSIDRLQMLVASDGRFKSMREALHRCDPPCIPYLGMYLTDLSFIEEGALNITENNLVNFCKMRMIAHVIREVQQYHQTPYLITHRREVTNYLLDPTRLLDEEQTYQASLTIEPRQSINRQVPTNFP